MVDEAHATGVLGPGGRGSVAAAGLEGEVDVIVGTLGKALGGYGAYVCCDAEMARYLVNTARTLIFSTGPPPPSVAAALAALELLREQPRLIERLLRNAARAARARSPDEGFDVPAGETQIVPLVLGDADARGRRLRARAAARACSRRRSGRRRCPRARSRLRLAAMATHTPAELRWAAAQLGGRRAARRARSRARCEPERARAVRVRRRGPRRAARRARRLTRRRLGRSAAPGLFVTGTDTEVGKTVRRLRDRRHAGRARASGSRSSSRR